MHIKDLPPAAALNTLINGAMISQMLAVTARLGIADKLEQGPEAVEKLAGQAEVDSQALYRVLRALASYGVFEEIEPQVFGLTPLADLLRHDAPGSQRMWAIMNGSPWYWGAVGHAMHSVKSGEPSFPHLFGKSTFELFNSDAEAGEIFYGTMTQMTRELLPVLLEAYDFSRYRHLVDVGGGHGALLQAVLEAYPEISGTLFDLGPVIDQVSATAENSTSRIRFKSGDFFKSVPEGGDGYLLKYIIHDWDDQQCIAILKNCRRAMADNGRLLIVENVLAPGNAPCPGKVLDLTMLLLEGGRERTADEFEALFRQSGLRTERIVPLIGSFCLIEAQPA